MRYYIIVNDALYSGMYMTKEWEETPYYKEAMPFRSEFAAQRYLRERGIEFIEFDEERGRYIYKRGSYIPTAIGY